MPDKTDKKLKVPAKKGIPSKGTPVKKGVKKANILKRTSRYFREVYVELKKVSWPTRKDVLSYSLAVLVFIAIFVVALFGMDSGFTALINLIVA